MSEEFPPRIQAEYDWDVNRFTLTIEGMERKWIGRIVRAYCSRENMFEMGLEPRRPARRTPA